MDKSRSAIYYEQNKLKYQATARKWYEKQKLNPAFVADRVKRRKTWALTPQGRFSHLKRECKRLKRELTLSPEEVYKFWELPCFYCGNDIPITGGHSLDRIDSSEGYIQGNVVSCCGRCNSMKSNDSLKDFKLRIKRIYKNLKL